MEVEISEWARERIAELVASGRVKDEREAVDCAFAAWVEDDRETEALFEGRSDEWWAELNDSLDRAVAELGAGKGIPFTAELIEGVVRRGRERLAGAHKPR
ncbi:hypothetical protein J0H33_09270 [bacterium]|jgi:hypothetical protein|nr:hypothetical protein [bacterium]